METASIIKIALATVGLTQMLKNLIGKGGKVLWTIITVLCGIGITVIQCLCPAVVMDGIIAVAGATVFYDTIYKTWENLFKKAFNRDTDGGEDVK